jgi:hypothetical protein
MIIQYKKNKLLQTTFTGTLYIHMEPMTFSIEKLLDLKKIRPSTCKLGYLIFFLIFLPKI